jgi:hypothetical protein
LSSRLAATTTPSKEPTFIAVRRADVEAYAFAAQDSISY